LDAITLLQDLERRDEIEQDFVAWKSPIAIAEEYGLADRMNVYRHATALGLFDRDDPNGARWRAPRGCRSTLSRILCFLKGECTLVSRAESTRIDRVN
jgi:hypothetical protein